MLNRPEKLNALNRETWRSLRAALEESCNDSSVKAVSITGSGRAFSAGDDIYDMYSFRDKDEAHRFFALIMETLKTLAACSKPVLSLVNGLAYGGGGEILLLTDYNITLKTATIAYPEALIGLFPPVLLTYGKRVIGPRIALQLASTGKPLTATEALELGIIDELVDTLEEGRSRVRIVAGYMRMEAGLARRFIFRGDIMAELEEALRVLAEKSVEPRARRLMEEWMKGRRRGR